MTTCRELLTTHSILRMHVPSPLLFTLRHHKMGLRVRKDTRRKHGKDEHEAGTECIYENTSVDVVVQGHRATEYTFPLHISIKFHWEELKVLSFHLNVSESVVVSFNIIIIIHNTKRLQQHAKYSQCAVSVCVCVCVKYIWNSFHQTQTQLSSAVLSSVRLWLLCYAAYVFHRLYCMLAQSFLFAFLFSSHFFTANDGCFFFVFFVFCFFFLLSALVSIEFGKPKNIFCYQFGCACKSHFHVKWACRLQMHRAYTNDRVSVGTWINKCM